MDEVDEVEIRNALSGLAALIRHFYLALLEEGFTEAQALELAKEKVGD